MTEPSASPLFPPYPSARLEAEGLAISRGDHVLADGLDFALGPGDAVLLRGPNGSGKTTLLRVLAGFTPAHDGEIRRKSEEGAAEPGDLVAYVGHADGLRRTETPSEHLNFITAWLGADAARVRIGMTHFAILPIADAPARRLSAGQKRRAALARLVAAPRPIWLLDEPAAPLDAAGRAALTDAVAAHRAAGGAVIAAVHDDPEWPATRVLQLTDFAPSRGARA